MVGGLTQGHDMTVDVALVPETAEGQTLRGAILTGYRDLAEGALFAATKDFKQDMAVLAEKERDVWR
jgi:hypothetical protein